jgi:hypothetical protein
LLTERVMARMFQQPQEPVILEEKGCIDNDEGAAVNSSKARAISERDRTSFYMMLISCIVMSMAHQSS